MPIAPDVLRRRNRLSALVRYRGDDDPTVVALRRESAVDAAARHLADVAPLTAAERARLAAVLAPLDAA